MEDNDVLHLKSGGFAIFNTEAEMIEVTVRPSWTQSPQPQLGHKHSWGRKPCLGGGEEPVCVWGSSAACLYTLLPLRDRNLRHFGMLTGRPEHQRPMLALRQRMPALQQLRRAAQASPPDMSWGKLLSWAYL